MTAVKFLVMPALRVHRRVGGQVAGAYGDVGLGDVPVHGVLDPGEDARRAGRDDLAQRLLQAADVRTAGLRGGISGLSGPGGAQGGAEGAGDNRDEGFDEPM
ncbi:hypothetical protein ABIA35_006809 [Catenulispora sp. MAP12-49]|uniref:hypothetical protein n=1 Tax=unclassified Catenulispora TaxID=414885 RepID=UPI003510F3B2